MKDKKLKTSGNKFGGITKSTEEDPAPVPIIRDTKHLTLARFIVILIMSVCILTIYMVMNRAFYPGYPVVTIFAEENEHFSKHYPPFRMEEWDNYSITEDIIRGKLYEDESLSRKRPIGFPFLGVYLTRKWGESGLYYTNAFILWISAQIFFLLMLELVAFPLALASTLILALATPNLFYASSAFSEPVAQLIIVLSLYFFIKGMMAQRMWLFNLLCGFTVGLNFFAQPPMTLTILLFVAVIMLERRKWSLSDNNVLWLLSGFLVPVVFCLIINRAYLGEYCTFFFSSQPCVYGSIKQHIYSEGGNTIAGLWNLLFNSPHGILFLMPVTIFIPMGIITMWRRKMKYVALIDGILLLYAALLISASPCPVTGDSLGSRQFVPFIPLLIIPLTFVWKEGAGEKICLVCTLVMTVYMCSFGWWTGTVKGKGALIGVLQDRDARYIILARKNKLVRPEFTSSNDLIEHYIDSLKKQNMKGWLETLDPVVFDEIYGFERMVFRHLNYKINTQDFDRNGFIESVDPDKGIHPVLPKLDSLFNMQNDTNF